MAWILKTLAGIVAALSLFIHPVHKHFSGTASWVRTEGSNLYDTPSGFLDFGYYVVLPDASVLANVATTTIPSGTTTTQVIPAGVHTMKTIPNGFTLAHAIGTHYVDYFSDGTSYIGSSTVDSNLNKPNAPVPTQAQDAAVNASL